MTTIRRSPPEARFHVELDATGDAGIRDRATGELYPASDVGDAHLDVAYLNDQDARRNPEEVRRHLESIVELSGTDPATMIPPPPVDPEAVLAALAEWTDALAFESAAHAARDTTDSLLRLRRELTAAEAGLDLREARFGDAVRQLYADPLSAQRLLAETSRSVSLPALAELVRNSPTVFGAAADTPAIRFGPAAAAADLAERAAALASAVIACHEAGSALSSLRASAASTLDLSAEATPQDLARSLDRRIAADQRGQLDPHVSVARATDRLRALLAITDKKTRDAALRRVPGAAPIAREALAHGAPHSLDRTF